VGGPPVDPRRQRRHRSRCAALVARGRHTGHRERAVADAAPWLDTRLALAPLHEEVLSATQWAQAGTALALCLIGIWRTTRQEVAP
jgi:hypothetical protein